MGAGVLLLIIGALAWAGWLSWFGRLPGDIRVERSNTRFYMPITSMIILSVVLSVLLALFRRMGR
jgi:membrane protein implicated in regulation of membrane protease activity